MTPFSPKPQLFKQVLGMVFLLATATAGWAADAAEITFLTWKPSIPEPWQRLVHRFERKHPSIRVKQRLVPQSSSQLRAILAQHLKNKDPSVDLFFMDVIWPPQFAGAGWVLDVSARFSREERDAFLPGPLTANTYRGKIYGIPSFLDAGLLFYRKDLLEKYGFEPPATWRRLLAQGRTIQAGEGDKTPYIYSAQFKQYEGLVCNMLEFIWSNGGKVVAAGGNEATLRERRVAEAVAFVRDRLIRGASPPGVLGYEEPESLAVFTQGKAVFHRNWPYAWTVANDPLRSRVAGRVGAAMLPAFAGHPSRPVLGGWQVGISRWSEHPDAAWSFARFLTSFESQKVLALDAGRAPTRKAVYTDPEVKKRASQLVAFLPTFTQARPRPVSPFYPMISEVLQRFFSMAISDPDSRIQDLAKEANGRIQQYLNLNSRKNR